MDPKRLAAVIIRGGIWQTPSVLDQPQIHLVRWRVLEVRNRDLKLEGHFVGYNIDGHEGRVSTSITFFDPATRKGGTRSGRIYELIGPPGYDSDAGWVWEVWSKLNKMTDEKDVTAEVWSLIHEGKSDE